MPKPRTGTETAKATSNTKAKPIEKAKVETIEKVETKAVVNTVKVLNKTNQKQVIDYKGTSHNLSPRGTIQLQGTLEEVEKNLIFWMRKEILSITKN
jgi:hypothetical protein